MLKIGLAFECQKIVQQTQFFDKEKHNIKLDAIVTEKKIYK